MFYLSLANALSVPTGSDTLVSSLVAGSVVGHILFASKAPHTLSLASGRVLNHVASNIVNNQLGFTSTPHTT